MLPKKLVPFILAFIFAIVFQVAQAANTPAEAQGPSGRGRQSHHLSEPVRPPKYFDRGTQRVYWPDNHTPGGTVEVVVNGQVRARGSGTSSGGAEVPRGQTTVVVREWKGNPRP